jgi:hypothetical protein
VKSASRKSIYDLDANPLEQVLVKQDGFI